MERYRSIRCANYLVLAGIECEWGGRGGNEAGEAGKSKI